MMIHPWFPLMHVPMHVTARQWQAAKQRPTCFGDAKHGPTNYPIYSKDYVQTDKGWLRK